MWTRYEELEVLDFIDILVFVWMWLTGTPV